MSDWKQRQFPAGTVVHVTDAQGFFLGIGALKEPYDCDRYASIADEDLDLGKAIDESPTIIMAEGRVLRGYECWWIPESEIDLPADFGMPFEAKIKAQASPAMPEKGDVR
jgi:hypothetical protein